MGVFRFKRFEVVNERSAMKVNTDGVLLGAAMTINSSDRVLLDIGTGTGTIALMAAQRFLDFARNDNADARNLTVHAIDIDAISAEEAAMNFSNSPAFRRRAIPSDHRQMRAAEMRVLTNTLAPCSQAMR